MPVLPLTGPSAQGRVALIDDDDLAALSAYNWYPKSEGKTVYAQAHTRRSDGRRTTVLMHRLLSEGAHVDHVNFDGLDNRRQNLRPATLEQSQQHRRSWGACHYKGVHWRSDRQRWRACIRLDGAKRHLGYFADADAAARAYDAAALAAFGPFALVNFPQTGATRA